MSSCMIGGYGNYVNGNIGLTLTVPYSKYDTFLDDTDQDRIVQKVPLISMSSAMYYQFKKRQICV